METIYAPSDVRSGCLGIFTVDMSACGATQEADCRAEMARTNNTTTLNAELVLVIWQIRRVEG
jgi:hypothetical protein